MSPSIIHDTQQKYSEFYHRKFNVMEGNKDEQDTQALCESHALQSSSTKPTVSEQDLCGTIDAIS